jgi:hypothetical protein
VEAVDRSEAVSVTALQERLFSRLIIDPEPGCLLWTGALSATGYGRITVNYRSREVHRLVYEMFAGPAADGMVLDHLCRVRHCANVSHLEPVTDRLNILRGISPSAVNATKTNCLCGREYDGVNVNGSRTCSECHRAANQRWRAKRVITERRSA